MVAIDCVFVNCNILRLLAFFFGVMAWNCTTILGNLKYRVLDAEIGHNSRAIMIQTRRGHGEELYDYLGNPKTDETGLLVGLVLKLIISFQINTSLI